MQVPPKYCLLVLPVDHLQMLIRVRADLGVQHNFKFSPLNWNIFILTAGDRPRPLQVSMQTPPQPNLPVLPVDHLRVRMRIRADLGVQQSGSDFGTRLHRDLSGLPEV